MAEKNPYDDLFSFAEDGAKAPAAGAAKAPVANARVAPADQKARDTDAAGILKGEWDRTIKALGVLRGTPVPAKKEDADALAANIQRAEADLASIGRELKNKGVEVTAPQASADAASAPASAPVPAASEASANPYAGLFGDMKTEPPASFEIDPFMAASGAAGAYAGGKYAGRQMDKLALMHLEREYALPPGTLTAASTKDLARLIAAPPRPVAPPAPAAVAPAGTPSAVVSPATPEGPLSAMEKWTNSQVGSESRLPSQVVSQFTSNVATDPSGAPQGILREAANTRKARALVPSSAIQVSPGGLPFVESTKERHANLIRQMEDARLAAIDNALLHPREPEAPPRAGPPVAAPPNAPRRGSMSPLQSRAANVGTGAVAGLGGGLQAYNMASKMQQGNTPDWTEGLSLAGNLAPILSRSRALGPIGALAQLPYLYKHWREIAAGLNMSDIMPFGVATLADENQPVYQAPGVVSDELMPRR